jgi:hypothetical protein
MIDAASMRALALGLGLASPVCVAIGVALGAWLL